jgi:acetyl esterase/lipase
MTPDRRALLGFAMLAGGAGLPHTAHAQSNARSAIIPLWPDGLPEAVPQGLREIVTERSTAPALRDRTIKGITAPRLEPVLPTRPNGASIIIMPGGGYRYLAWDKEGPDIANWFAQRGVTAFSLAYRLPGDGWASGPDTPLADVQRAVRIVRSRSAKWGLNPNQIGVLGFSAGGHLAANLGAQFGRVAYQPRDAVDGVSARPNLVAPIYPAILIEQLASRFPAGEGIFGKALSSAQTALHTPSLNVPIDAPPHCLVHAEDDPLVGPEHSLALRAALVARKIPVETHLYAKGGHGFGLRGTNGLSVANWPERVLAFGRTTGWIS